MQDLLNNYKSTTKLLGLSLLVLALSACSTSTTNTPTTAANTEGRYDYVLTVDVAADDVQADIERDYEGEAVVWQPEAGFAVLGLKHGEFSTLKRNAESNLDAVSSPITAAGFNAWAGGFDSWAGGNDSWAGGFDAWAGGSDIWQEDNLSLGAFAENVEEFTQIKLGAGQDLAPNLGAGVIIAVLDTGVDLDHVALATKLTPSSTWYDFVDTDAYPNDEGSLRHNESVAYGHGTAVAGIILQVAPQAQIMPVRVLNPDGGGDFSDIAAGIDWAIAHGADVINLSLGSQEVSPTIMVLLNYAAAQGVYVFASSGNTGDSHVTHPAAESYNPQYGGYLIGVGSVNKADIKSDFTAYSRDLELVAPGERIYTFGPDDTVMHVTGTSFSTPLAAGTLALGLGEVSELGNTNIYDTLSNVLSDASDASLYDQRRNREYQNKMGKGRLDVEAFMNTILGTGN